MATFKQILQRPAYNLNPDHLATNTWPNRHEYVISVAQNLIYADKRNISISIFGPGGASANYARKLEKGDESKFKESWMDRRKQQIISLGESRQRNKPHAQLVCWEPQEWFDALSCVGIKRIDVYDKHQQVLDAVKRLNIPDLCTHLIDIDVPLQEELPKSDVSIALRVLEYCKCPLVAYDNITSTLKEPSWLVLSIPNMHRPARHDMELKWAKADRRIYYMGKTFHAPHIDEKSIERIMCAP